MIFLFVLRVLTSLLVEIICIACFGIDELFPTMRYLILILLHNSEIIEWGKPRITSIVTALPPIFVRIKYINTLSFLQVELIIFLRGEIVKNNSPWHWTNFATNELIYRIMHFKTVYCVLCTTHMLMLMVNSAVYYTVQCCSIFVGVPEICVENIFLQKTALVLGTRRLQQ
jgi:hypothetical protein